MPGFSKPTLHRGVLRRYPSERQRRGASRLGSKYQTLSRSLCGKPGNLFKDDGYEGMFEEVMKHFEQQAPVSVMARVALQGALGPAHSSSGAMAERSWAWASSTATRSVTSPRSGS